MICGIIRWSITSKPGNVQAALDFDQMTIIVCKCESGNIRVPVIDIDPVVIRDRFMKEVNSRNSD